MQEFVSIAMACQERDDLALSEARDAVRGEHRVALSAKQPDRLREIVRPGLRIAHQCPAGRQEVVHGQIRVLAMNTARNWGR